LQYYLTVIKQYHSLGYKCSSASSSSKQSFRRKKQPNNFSTFLELEHDKVPENDFHN
jgi:hypothetical protein